MNSKQALQAIVDQINRTTSILIVLPLAGGADVVGGALALGGFLQKLEKQVSLFSPTPIDPGLAFLPDFRQITRDLNVTKSFVIDLSTKKTLIEEVSYKKESDKLSIFIKPKRGQFEPQDVSFSTSNFPFDLIICLGVLSFEELGEFYFQHAELFFETPVVNIDYRGNNEHYGQFNLVNLTATSVSEIIFDLVLFVEQGLIDEHIATQLLTGIIAETNSFQHTKTTPQAFLKASTLVNLGARQQEIISQLYKQKSLGLLKFWGRVLARLQHDSDLMLVYSFLSRADLEKSGATAQDAAAIINQMFSSLAFAKAFLFGQEVSADRTEVYCMTTLPLNLKTVFSPFSPSGSMQSVIFLVPAALTEAQTRVLTLLRQAMPKLNS